MLNKSIAYRLSIYVSLAVVAVFIVFISIYLLFNIKLIEENIENKAMNISSEVKGNINQYVKVTEEVTENVSNQIIFYDEHGHVQEFLVQILQKYPFLNAIHVNLDSTVAADYHNFFCLNTKDSIQFLKDNKPIESCVVMQTKYRELAEEGASKWSDPLHCDLNQKIVVSYYYPVYETVKNKKPRIIGEIITELSLSELSQKVNEIKVGENGYAFLISKDGTYISHPNKDWILNKTIFDIPQNVLKSKKPDLQNFLANPVSGSVIAHPEVLGYQKSMVYYSQLDNGWILNIVIPYREMFEPLFLPILKMLFFSVLGILVIYILITYITNRQIQPLSELTSQLKRLSSLSGETVAGEETMNEIKHVSQSLNLLKMWYEKNKIRVSREEKLNKLKDNDIYQAAEIQQSLIKVDYPAFPNNPELDLYTSYKPARVVSGDLYDYFFRDKDHLVISIGDVSGKGVSAAFFMSVAQTVIKSVAVDSHYAACSELVERVNKELYSNNVHQFFLTLFLGILDLQSGKLTYCNAAHTASFILKANGRLDVLVETHGLPLGLYRGKGYGEGTYTMGKGDSLILYTDGVTELQNENGDQYGQVRFQQNLKSLKGLDPKEMVERIEKSLQLFMGESTQNDDISILVFRYDQ